MSDRALQDLMKEFYEKGLGGTLPGSSVNGVIDLGGKYEIREVPGGVGSIPEALGVYVTVGGVETFLGSLGDVFAQQLTFTKAYGGVRFYNEQDGFEYFGLRRNTSDGAKGIVVGSLDDENYVATDENGGLSVFHRTDTTVTQQLGNPASTNYIAGTEFTFQIESDQVKPYGILGFNLTGETDVDFTDVPFDVRILDASGTEVYSDIQNTAVWEQEPQPTGNPRFKISSNAGTVVLPLSQPFVMYQGTTYTVEYRFAQSIRLKGDGVQPALLLSGDRVEFFPINYTSEVFVKTSNFTVNSGGEYLVNTTGGPIVATVHPTVKSATFSDFAATWTGTNSLTVVTDLGNIVFNNNEAGSGYKIIRTPTQWRIYNLDGSLHEVTP